MAKERKDKHFIKKPKYPGGQAALKKFISTNLKYPEEALKHQIQGTVSVKYTIGHTGKVIEAHVVAGIGYGCDEEAIRLTKLLKFEVPKVYKLRVKYHKDIHIHFRKPKQKPKAKVKYQYQVSSKDQESKQPASGQSYHYTIQIQKK